MSVLATLLSPLLKSDLSTVQAYERIGFGIIHGSLHLLHRIRLVDFAPTG